MCQSSGVPVVFKHTVPDKDLRTCTLYHVWYNVFMQCKNLVWLFSSKKNLKKFPKQVQKHVGYALFRAQQGRTHHDAKLMKGFKANVWEIVTRHFGNTYRTVYYIKINEVVYVLHAFQKKSKHGIATSKNEIDIIKKRINTIL
jgi:phage-related protein